MIPVQKESSIPIFQRYKRFIFGKLIGPFFLLIVNVCFAIDIGITSDTLTVSPENYAIPLSNTFIVEPILKMTCSHQITPKYRLEKIPGIIHFDKPDSAYRCIVKYRYLIEKPPLVVGPKALQLPTLEELSTDTSDYIEPQPKQTRDEPESQLISNGTIFRSIEISPFGGTDFTGGLQLQIQGKLTDNMEVTGVLSDQNLNIQPEGTTQSLDEIDKIYLKVGHPNFEILAGDIQYQKRSGTFYQVDRKLNGMMGQYQKGPLQSSAVFAKSEGKYYKKLFIGTEGKQGPYYLTSAEGSRNIIVQAGTEKIWLDGERLTRGENKDYTIDYSLGEITFTPKQLIHFDSEIFVEYQYSDFQYNQQIAGSSVHYKMGENKTIQLSWFHEHDVYTDESSGLTSEYIDLLKTAGDSQIHISGAVEDEEGDYILTDSIYVYSPESDSMKYTVHFYQDQLSGTYKRTVNEDGNIIFEFVPESERDLLIENIDLYTPSKKLVSPKGFDVIQSKFAVDVNRIGQFEIETAVSSFDLNRISDSGDDDNSGFAHHIQYHSRKMKLPGDMKLSVQFANRRKGDRYHAIQRDKPVTYEGDWNISTSVGMLEDQLSGNVVLESDSLGEFNLGWKHLTLGQKKYKRMNSNVSMHLNYIPEITAAINQVKTDEWTFTQRSGEVLFLDGDFHPFFSYEDEKESAGSQFEHSKGGVQWETGKGTLSTSIGKRIDWDQHSEEGLIKTHSGIFGELDWEGRTRSGWRQNIAYRQRVLNNYEDNVNQSYNLWRVNIGYYMPKKAVQWDVKTKLEETFIENRAVIYDSVGTGFGTHRHDEDLQEYIPDPNGSFIAYTVLTGVRKPSTHIQGSQKLILDLKRSRWSSLHPFIVRFTGMLDYQGGGAHFDRIFSSDNTDVNTTQSKWIFREESSYNPKKSSRKIRQWYQQIHHLNGLDPRGKDLRKEKEIGIELFESLTKQLQAQIRLEYHQFDVNSMISDHRNRDGNGIWIEAGLKQTSHSNQQIDIMLLAGQAAGDIWENPFQANSVGCRGNISWFFSKSKRIQIVSEWNKVKEVSGLNTIPPEIMNGLPIGHSLRTTIQSSMMIGNNWSINASLNYINDQRYDHFITMTGELCVIL